MEPALCRQSVLILWPPPQLQRVGNKPFSSNLQTVQQSMGNYLSQSMGQAFCSSLCLPLLLSSCMYPLSPVHPPSPHTSPPHPFCLIFAVSLFFPPTPSSPTPTPQPPLTCISSSSLSSAAPILKCDSSAAPLTKVAFTHGACHITGLTFLLNMRVELVVKPNVCAPCCRPWFSVRSCIKQCYFSIFRFRVYFNRFTKLPLLKLSD